jgi:hypothetical protein
MMMTRRSICMSGWTQWPRRESIPRGRPSRSRGEAPQAQLLFHEPEDSDLGEAMAAAGGGGEPPRP